MTNLRFVLSLTSLLALTLGTSEAQQQPQLKLQYNQPAEKWTDALPIGNGKLGGMVFGGVAQDRIQFNEATLWTGRPRTYYREGAAQYLGPIRQLLADGKQAEAEALAEQHFMGVKDHEGEYDAQKAAWLQKVGAVNVAAALAPGHTWQNLAVPTPNGWESAGLEGLDGAVWFKTSFDVPQAWAGKNLTVALGRIRDVDYTYVNGTQIGTDEGISKKRRYTIPAAALHAGKNQLVIKVLNFYDKGGLIGVKEKQPVFVVYPEGGSPETNVPLDPNWQYWIQDDQPPLFPSFEASYQPFGDVYLDFPQAGTPTNYHRELDLNEAITRVSYTSNGVNYRREYFASAPRQALIWHLSADKKGAINLAAALKSSHKQMSTRRVDDHTLALSVQVRDGVLRGVSYLHVEAKRGKVTVTNDQIRLENVDEATFTLTAATSFKNYKDVSADPEKLATQALARAKARSTTH